ncbi:hypothetical protein BD769DRAFT_1391663 [Suillus cothurnatus]|nr:hypothetical protein BD769DRAFT_1391663 [Suillus cothurnatus]
MTQNYSQWYKYHITNGKNKKQKIKEIPPEDTELEYTMDVDSPTSITSELLIESTILVKPITIPIESSTLPIESTIPVKPNVTPITPSIPTTVPDSVCLNDLIDPVLKMISNHNSINPSDTVTETAATDPAIPKPAHVNIPEVPPASIVPQVKNPLKHGSRVAGVSGTFRQMPSSLSSPPIPVTPPIPATPLIPMTSPIPTTPSTSSKSIISVTTSMTSAPSTVNAKSKPKPHPVKAKTPAVLKVPNAPNKAKAMHIQKTINAQNLCVSAWKAAGNLLGTAKQFKVYWEQLPTADKAVFEVRAKALLATNALTAVATSRAQGNTEEEFAGSDGDE